MKIYYINNKGQTIDLLEGFCRIFDSDLFNYEWSYETQEGQIPKVSRFYLDLWKKKFKIAVSAASVEAYNSIMEGILSVFEQDVLERSPGRLYVGDTYLNCYITSSVKSDWYPEVPFVVNEFSVVAESSWIKENSISYCAGEVTDTNSKKYVYKYPYKYAVGVKDAVLKNIHYTDCNFKMIFYGPCLNPHVIIGEHRYQVYVLLEVGEYLTIDSKGKTVEKVMNDGTRVSCFHERQKKPSVFQKIPPGEHRLSSPGNFDFDIILYVERSEPEWI